MLQRYPELIGIESNAVIFCLLPEVEGWLGWETADMGQVEAARATEPLCMLWCIPGFLRNEWMHAFKLLTA